MDSSKSFTWIYICGCSARDAVYATGPFFAAVFILRAPHRNLLDASQPQNHVLREQNCQI
jgi:hypothetical protein